MTTYLQELKNRRRELDRQIKILEECGEICGCVKLGYSRYSTTRDNEWYIAVKVIQNAEIGNSIWRTIIRCVDKDETISHIDDVVRDLTELKERLKGANDD